jgi:flavodoxin
MDILVIYDSRYGNTERIARAIAARLGATNHVRLLTTSAAAASDLSSADLLIVGGPTHRHRVSEAMQTFLDALPRGRLHGVAVAAFDTRYPGARWLTGSAAVRIGQALKRRGARLIVAPESFLMEQDRPPQGEKRRHEIERLAEGEEERAATWAAGIAARALPMAEAIP